MNKKTIAWTVGILVVILLILTLILTRQNDTRTYKIGAILPLTGSGSLWGQNAQKGINLAVDEINSRGLINGGRVKVVFEDSQSVPHQAINAFRKLTEVDRVTCSIVDMISSNVLAIAPIANEKGVVVISPGASSPEITTAGDFIFRNWPSDALQGEELARFVYGQRFKKAAILYIQNEFGEGLKNVFSRTYTSMGGEIVVSEMFPQGGTDFRAQVSKVKASRPDAVVMFVYPPEGIRVIRQLREAQVNLQLFATAEIEDPLILNDRRAEGLIYPFPKAPDDTDAVRGRFIESFKRKYGEAPGVVADIAYDAVYLLVNSIIENGYDAQKIRAGLLQIKKYHGASGEISFDENGDVIKPFVFKVIRDGKTNLFESD